MHAYAGAKTTFGFWWDARITKTHLFLTFKQPVFTQVNALKKKHPSNSFYIVRQQGNLLHS